MFAIDRPFKAINHRVEHTSVRSVRRSSRSASSLSEGTDMITDVKSTDSRTTSKVSLASDNRRGLSAVFSVSRSMPYFAFCRFCLSAVHRLLGSMLFTCKSPFLGSQLLGIETAGLWFSFRFISAVHSALALEPLLPPPSYLQAVYKPSISYTWAIYKLYLRYILHSISYT